MSAEQWGVLAAIVLWTLLQGASRLRQTRVGNDRPSNRVPQPPPSAWRGTSPANRNASGSVTGAAATAAIPPPPSSLPPPLPQPAKAPAVRLAYPRASHRRVSPASGAAEAPKRVYAPLSGDDLAQWLRPTRNLRRAIVVAMILGPPSQ